ncbi:MAG: FG-GAP repeat protein [Deltaproteobacteria bacterium]|nr:FG-GAP repeat protein [Deltaproteobacteria bacterium]
MVLWLSGFLFLTASVVQAAFDRYDDLAVGIPNKAVGWESSDSGAAAVFYGAPPGLAMDGQFDDQLWSRDTPGIEGYASLFDHFGASLVVGDFNGDGQQDLAVGVPDGKFGTSDGGVVYIIFGGPIGLRNTGSQLWTQERTETGNISGGSDAFGFSLAAGDFNKDGFSDLAIGVPNRQIFTAARAGAVYVLYGSGVGLTNLNSQVWHQGVAGMAGGVEEFDNFGHSLTTGDFNGDGFVDLAVGAPGEGVSGFILAGAVHIIYGSASGLSATSNQLWHEELLGFPTGVSHFFGWALTAGDYNGDGKADLAIGTPGANLEAGGADRGAVMVLYGTVSGLSASGQQYWRQGASGINGTAKDNDRFGEALASGDFNGDGYSDLSVGAPGDDVSGVAGSGAVNVIYGSSLGLIALNNQIWHQDLFSGSAAEVDDAFGKALASGDFNGDGFFDLAVGVPQEDLLSLLKAIPNAGAVHIVYGSPAGLTSISSMFLHQNTGGVLGAAENDDRFGSALAAGKFGKPEGLLFLPLILRN